MAAKTKYFYYRIYDDEEQSNNFKSTLEEKKIRRILKAYEKKHEGYHNKEFVDFLKKHDPKAEFIEVTYISY
ncbi:MAG TPA: hypothetical protein VK470_11945 [Bacteroidota bacterium]|nr:hypothetical protein [Bacteroidota bacterium]